MLEYLEDYWGLILFLLFLMLVAGYGIYDTYNNYSTENIIVVNYTFTCINNIEYIVQNNEIKTPHYNIDGGIYTCE